ncbi:hypothetical protein E4U46_004282 [Claviceps purpurea]|nr:hypothetical protein E4U46_004282 [Claviceps purpurea]
MSPDIGYIIIEDYIKHDDNEPNTEEPRRLDALGLSVKAAVVKPLPATSPFDCLRPAWTVVRESDFRI